MYVKMKPKCKAMTGKKAMPAESMRRKYDLQPTLRLSLHCGADVYQTSAFLEKLDNL